MSHKKSLIVGIRGKAGSGKDTMADYLVNNYGFKKMSFATALKHIVVILTGWTIEFVNGTNADLRHLRETLVHPFYKMTCRQLLQFIGTDLFRNQLNQNIWIQTVRNEIAEYSEACKKANKEPRIVFTDARFPNEVEMIRELDGTMFKIIRPDNNCLNNDTKKHESEHDFDVQNEIIIMNDNSLENFIANIESRIDIISQS